MKTLKDYILERLASGKFFFSKQEAIEILGLDQVRFRFQAYRLSQKGVVKRLLGDFFMIIPTEYYHLGSLPPHWIVGPLMQYLGLENDYYIGLLSAASLYGATDQQPMTLQVIVNKQLKTIVLERSTIEFHQSKDCLIAAKSVLSVATGYVKVSPREQTIVDLIKFYKVSGYLSNVALVIKTLALEADSDRFRVVVKKESNKAALQRLGYLLDFMQLSDLAGIVEQSLHHRSIEYVLLRPDHHEKNGTKQKRWKIIINDTVEAT